LLLQRTMPWQKMILPQPTPWGKLHGNSLYCHVRKVFRCNKLYQRTLFLRNKGYCNKLCGSLITHCKKGESQHTSVLSIAYANETYLLHLGLSQR
jgi:hypothetical protein